MNRASQNEKARLAESYNTLYSQFSAEEVREVGNYTIQKLIGSGAFGKVYLAKHKLTHTKVVLKTGAKNDPNLVREVFYHRQFKHPHITRLYEVVISEGMVWLVLEWCPGGELYEYLLQQGRIPVDDTRRLFAQIASAVYYAHSLNCIHRDLKLENILLDKKLNAKLTDFGFTRECEARSLLETVCGTTVYMAPELIEKKKYDGFKIDLWSLGVILYTLLYGGMPFEDEDEVKTQFQILNDEPKYKQDVPPDAIALMQKLLQKDPQKRPSVREILTDPFLDYYGPVQVENTDTLVKNTLNQRFFQSKVEKGLLKKLKTLGIDTHAMKKSVINRQCDSLSGLYELLLDKEKKRQSKKYKARSRSVLRITAEQTSKRMSQFMDPLGTPQLSRIVSMRSNPPAKDNHSVGSMSSPEKRKVPTFLQKVTKLFKITKKDDATLAQPLDSGNHDEDQNIAPETQRSSVSRPVPPNIVIQAPVHAVKRTQRPRPASVLSTHSVLSNLTTMSDMSAASANEDTTTAQRPQFTRKSSAENSIRQSRRSLSLISSNSSNSERSSTMNSLSETTTSSDVRVIQFSRGRKFNESVFPRSTRRRKSPLGGGIPPSSRFKRSRAQVIEEQEEDGSIEDLDAEMGHLGINGKSSDFED